MIQETTLAAPCGIFCGDCEFLDKDCTGCRQVHGKPFWAEKYKMEVCRLYDCCVNEKTLEHCGLCEELPCEMFLSMRDPSMTDEEYEQSLKQRQSDLLRRKEIGTEAWLKDKKQKSH